MVQRRRSRKAKLEKFIFSKRFLILLIFFIGLALGFVRIRFEETRIGYEISVNEKREKEAVSEKSFLEAKHMELRSPKRIQELAREMGFKFPTQEDVIYIEQPTVVGDKR